MPAVLDRPETLLAQPSRPSQERRLAAGERPLLEHPPGLIDSNRRQRLLVDVNPDYDH